MSKASGVTSVDCRIIAELISKALCTINTTGYPAMIALYEDLPIPDEVVYGETRLLDHHQMLRALHKIVVDAAVYLGLPIVDESEYAFAKQKNDRTNASCLVHLRYRDLSAFKYYDAVVNYTVTETKIIVKITRNKLGESGILFEAERSK